jgi:hypothetical protein
MKRRLLALAAASTCLCCASALAQGTKTLLVDRPLGHDPIRIMRAMDGTTVLKSDLKQFPSHFAWEAMFDAGDDWLKNISFVIKNVSAKTITYLQVDCTLHETNDWQAEIAKHHTVPTVGRASNRVGWRPKNALYSPITGKLHKPDADERPAFELAPGQEFTIALEDPQSYPSLKSQIEAVEPISAVTACNSGIGDIYFEDGSRWNQHQYWRATDQPGGWTTIPFDEWSSLAKTTQ